MPAQRSIALAMVLADHAAAGVPVDGTTIAAAVVADGVCSGYIPMATVHSQLGMEVRRTPAAAHLQLPTVLRLVHACTTHGLHTSFVSDSTM